ncbi:MAG: amidohydrolase [Verrucomicrobia bacterium]|nr:amidohydrolase [Verrucomicrobiota bacterium]
MQHTSLASILAALLTPTISGQPQTAESLFKNGNLYTVNERQPRAEAIAVKDGKIVFVGSNSAAQAHEGPNTRVIDLRGGTVVPGLTDSHYHLAGVGAREMTLNLEGITSLQEFLAKVKERIARATPGEWVSGRGWIETFWKPPVFPTRWDLDSISPDNPVFLTRADGHGAVANSAALRIAGIDKQISNPPGGEIMRDKATGEPTGMLVDRAQALVGGHLPAQAEVEREQALLLGVKRSLELGWTQIQNAGSSLSEVERLRALYAQGRIKLRIYEAIRGPGGDAQKLIREGSTVGPFGQSLTVRTIKVSIDGALGSKGAALLEPYADHDTAGLLMHREADLMPMFVEALRNGIQIETHAIGDRANRVILDLYEKAFRAVPPDQRKVKDPRWRVEHAQLVHPSDIPRFAKLGVIPSMQPSHAIGDLHFAPSRLGIQRLEGAYAWQSFLKAGSIIAGGSDAPVERGEPMIEFYAAVARKDQSGFSGKGWHPEQAVTREQALKMFTIWPAYAAFEENLRGSIEPGKLADFTVFSADIMKIPEAEILKTRCVMTVIGGEVVFEAGR